MQGLREREVETNRSVVDKFKVMGPIRAELGLELTEIPDQSTLCKATDQLKMVLGQRLLQRSTKLQEFGDMAAIDASSFNRIAAIRWLRSSNRLSVPGHEDDAARGLFDRGYHRHFLHG